MENSSEPKFELSEMTNSEETSLLGTGVVLKGNAKKTKPKAAPKQPSKASTKAKTLPVNGTEAALENIAGTEVEKKKPPPKKRRSKEPAIQEVSKKKPKKGANADEAVDTEEIVTTAPCLMLIDDALVWCGRYVFSKNNYDIHTMLPIDPTKIKFEFSPSYRTSASVASGLLVIGLVVNEKYCSSKNGIFARINK